MSNYSAPAVPEAAPLTLDAIHRHPGRRCRNVDPDLFFPIKANEIAAGPAAAICRDCPIRAACLRYALRAGEQHGVWGGYSPRQRRALIRKHGRPA